MTFRLPGLARMTHEEYRANVEGLNIVFGAVLGFVLAGAEALENWDFAVVLFLSAGAVITILYLGSSRHPLVYGVLALFWVVALPFLIQDITGSPAPPKLQATLGVWTALVMLLELAPREGRKARQGD